MLLCALFASILLELTEILAHIFSQGWNSVWSKTQADFVTALREISHLPPIFAPFHRRSAQPKVDFSWFASLEPCRNGWQKEELPFRVWIDDIEIPKCQHALPNALHLGVFKKVVAMKALMFWVFPQNAVAGSWWHADARTKDRTCAKERPPKFLEFILNLVKLVIWQWVLPLNAIVI